MEKKLTAYMKETVIRLLPLCRTEVEDALALIARSVPKDAEPLPLQMLAVRRYLRMGADTRGQTIAAAWAWTPEEAKKLSQEGKAKLLMEEAEKVQRQFKARSPDCSLGLSPLRSLERQVRAGTAPTR